MTRTGALFLLLLLASPARALDVHHYMLDLSILPGAQLVEANASIELTVTEEDFVAGKFPLDFQGFTIYTVAVDGLLVDFEHSGGLLTVALPEGSGPGDHQVEVSYYGTPEPYVTDWGTWGMVFEENRVFTVNVIEGARHWFPCHDVLTDKASFELWLNVPQPWQVAAPGELLELQVGDAVNLFHWQADWELPTYLMHFAAAPYEVVEETHDGIPYQYYLYPTPWDEAKETLDHAPQAMAMLSKLYGDYPFPKVSFNEINLGGAVEQPSSVSIGTQIFAAPEDFAEVVAHEMAHSWFQGIVTIADWKDLWLSEGLATYHEVLYFGHLNGVEAEQSYARSLALSYRTTADMSEGIFPVYDPDEMWGVTVYRKGAMVFHMLRFLVGDETFFAILNDYLDTYGGANAATADFLALAASHTDADLALFFDEWVFGQGYLKLDVAWQWDGEAADVIITQVQPEAWGTYVSVPLPIRFFGPPDAAFDQLLTLDGRETTVHIDVPFEPAGIEVDPEGWLLLKTNFVDFPELPPVDEDAFPEAVGTADVSTPDFAETVTPDVSDADTVIVVEEPDKKSSGGGCRMGQRSSPLYLVLLALVYALERLRKRRQSIGRSPH